MLKIGRETSFRHPIVFQKNFKRVKSKRSAAYFQYISTFLNLAYNKTKLYKTLDYWSRDMFKFDFLEKGLGIFSSSHFVYDISRKTFLRLHSINWPNSIAWLPLLLEILFTMCVAIVCFPGWDVINVEINLNFLIKPFFSMPKMSRQNF